MCFPPDRPKGRGRKERRLKKAGSKKNLCLLRSEQTGRRSIENSA